MIDRTNVLLRRHVLVVDDSLLRPGTAAGRAVHELVGEFTRRGVAVTESTSFADGAAVVASDAGIGAVLVDWDLDADDPASHKAAARILAAIRSRNASLPIFILAKGDAEHTITVEAMEYANELVWRLQDTATSAAWSRRSSVRSSTTTVSRSTPGPSLATRAESPT
jgi:arginine decarboxylase